MTRLVARALIAKPLRDNIVLIDTADSRSPWQRLFVTGSLNPIFTVRETHGRVLRLGSRLIAHSPDIGWRSLYAAILEGAPFQATEPPFITLP